MSDDITEKEIIEKLGDQEWRINHLYFVKDGTGKKVLFKMNPIQKELFDNLHSRNVIPKARKLGVCLDPNTKVLTSDLRWVAISDLSPGDEVVGVDEECQESGGGKADTRKMRTGVVEAVREVRENAYRINFDDGRSVICTEHHRWLSMKTNLGQKWRSIYGIGIGAKRAKLNVGTKVRYITKPWGEPSIEDGWFGGILDGEGSLAKPERLGVSLCVAQKRGKVLDRVIAYAENREYRFRTEDDNGRKTVAGIAVPKIVFGRVGEVFRIIGQTRPVRFLDRRWWENKRPPNECWATIVSIEPLGERRMIDLQTSIKTFIAEGFVSHNSTFFGILALDHILFTENRTAGIIAHTQDAMKKLFRNTILFAVDNMHPWLKSYIGKPDISTANELKFNNGGQIFVSLTTRGDTPNFLHISELGYISLHAPDKAAEVISGGVNSVTVDPMNMVSIESTADSGRMGPFFEICMAAEKLRLSGDPLTALDFKIHFFPWWRDSQYELHNAEHVVLTRDQEDYFKNLEKEIGQKLSIEKKRWWVKSKEINGQNMFVQFPGTLTEAFSVSLEGAYFKHEMDAVFAENRVAFFPIDPMFPVTTSWDLGMSDSTAIVFFQSIGPEIRFVDYYENHGVGLDHYVKVLRDKGYKYNRHILPHDIQVKDLSTGVSRLNFLWELGVRDTIVAPKVFIADTIEKVRILFPRFRFDKGNTSKLVESLQIYRKEFDETHGTWMEKPYHGPESHAVDSVRTLATVWAEEFSSGAYTNEWGDPVQEGGVKIVNFFD